MSILRLLNRGSAINGRRLIRYNPYCNNFREGSIQILDPAVLQRDLLYRPAIQTTARTIMSKSTTNEWEHSPAEFDFRSDTLTTPTPTMLSTLPHISLGDDVYQESTTTTLFESRLATLFQKPAALFVLSGTMGNQLCLRAHLQQPPHSILANHKAHVLCNEAGGLAMLSQAMTTAVVPGNGKYLTLEDVKKHVMLTEDIHFAPTRVIVLENTIGGIILPLPELARIATFAKSNGIKIHLDGARLWNACSVPNAPGLAEYASYVDSLSVCFSKSLGAPVGSIILGEKELVEKARHIRKAIGGGIRQAGVLTGMAEVALDEVFLKGRLSEGNEYAKRLGEKWVKLGGKLELQVDTNMVWLDLEGRGVSHEEWVEEGERQGVKVEGRLVCHFQNSEKAIEKVEKAMETVCQRADERRAHESGACGK